MLFIYLASKPAEQKPTPKFVTTNIEQLFGINHAQQIKTSILANFQKPIVEPISNDDDVQILTPPPTKPPPLTKLATPQLQKIIFSPNKFIKPNQMQSTSGATKPISSLTPGNTILIPLQNTPGVEGKSPRFLIATSTNPINAPSNIIASAASAAGISTPTSVPVVKKVTTPVTKMQVVDLEKADVKTPPTSVVKPTMQTVAKPIAQQLDWSTSTFRAPAKEDKYTYVVRMDRKPSDQPYFILTANPTKLSSPPELTKQNVGIICKDVYRAEVAKKKAKESSGSFSNIGLHTWAKHIIWLKQLSLPGKLPLYLKESADKVLEYGQFGRLNRKIIQTPPEKVVTPVAAKPERVGLTPIAPKPISKVDLPDQNSSKLFLIPITTTKPDGTSVQSFQVANFVPQGGQSTISSPSTSKNTKTTTTEMLSPSNLKENLNRILNNTSRKLLSPARLASAVSLPNTTPVKAIINSPVKSSNVVVTSPAPKKTEENVRRTEIVYEEETDFNYDMECVSENDELENEIDEGDEYLEDEEHMEIERLEDDDDEEWTGKIFTLYYKQGFYSLEDGPNLNFVCPLRHNYEQFIRLAAIKAALQFNKVLRNFF